MKITLKRLACLGASFTSALAMADAASPPVLSPAVPFDVTANPPFTLDSLQHDFDVLSWQTFVALNWPANADGSANTSAQIGAPGKTVWESWKESYEIFLPKGQKPVGWDQQAPVPAACQGKGDLPVLQQMGKVAGVQEKHAGPPGYYLATLWITFFPWMPLFILAIASLWADRRAQRMRILLGWSLPFWLLYALFPTKLPHYLLPTFPAFCAMLAYWLVSRNEQSQGALLRWAAAAMFALTGLILASVNIVVVPLLERQFPLWGIVAGIAAIPVVLVGARALAQGRLGGFAGLAMLSALLIYPALMQITLPSLQSFLLTPRLVALWNNFNGCTDAPLVATGYHEPSLVFETATDTKLVGLAQAVKLLNGPSAYLVALEARGEETLDQKLAGQDLSVRILGQVTGTNYNRGGISMIYLLANPDDRAFNACLDERPKALQ